MRHKLIPSSKIYVDRSAVSGRGVFASKGISEAEVVEECHLIVSGCPANLQDKELARYVFLIAFDKKQNLEINEELEFLASVKLHFDDEEMAKSTKDRLHELGYSDPSSLFSTATVLGCGMIYNHSKDPNLAWEFDMENILFKFAAIRQIDEGEELFISYGKNYWNKQ